MANVQKYFEEFHELIRIDYDTSQDLRDKRDIILSVVRDYLTEEGLPSFRGLLQGSFQMKTGVKPIADLEHDIDIGLRFDLRPEEYSASEVRRWVYNSVKDHTDKVERKNSCIRVTYADGYHVDLVVYAYWKDDFGNKHYRLAHKSDGWREADPPGLLEFVKDKREPFQDTKDGATKTDQFRRCVRYLKRWNDIAIPRDEAGKPTGLAFVLLCAERLCRTVSLNGDPDDRRALEHLAAGLTQVFGRILAPKPTPEYEDVLGQMSDKQMERLKVRFGELKDALERADSEVDPVVACEILQGVLGDDFPVPDPEETACKTSSPAILTSSASA